MCSLTFSRIAALGLLGTCPFQPLSGQGSLTPPGPPGPTQKSLAQIEPRIPIDTIAVLPGAKYFIVDSGSYYLTGNITVTNGNPAIVVAAPNVTIDLNGFAITGSGPTTGHAIAIGGLDNVSLATRITNGSIRNFAGAGIVTTGSAAQVHDLQISDLAIETCAQAGILATVDTTATIRRVTVQSCGLGIKISGPGTVAQCNVANISASAATVGISATQVLDSTVSSVVSTGNAALGIEAAVVSRCRVRDISGGGGTTSGIAATAPAAVSECSVANVTSSGAASGITGQTITRCAVSGVAADFNATGISAGSGSLVADCTVDATNGQTITSLAVGILGDKVATSTVSRTGSSGAALLCGIQGTDVSHCRITGLGNASTPGFGTSYGINAGQITDCSADGLGAGSQIRLELLRGTHVANCRIASVNVGSFAILINAAHVRHCSIHTASSGSVLQGIVGQRIEGCDVSNLSATSFVTGIIGNQILHSRVSYITSSQSATALQANGSPTSIQGCGVHGSSHVGIAMGSETGVVRDCELHGTIQGNAFGTIGISADTTNGHLRIENNHVTRFATGISAASNAGIYVLRNTVGSCPTAAYTLGANVQAGPIIGSGGGVGSASAWANFTF